MHIQYFNEYSYNLNRNMEFKVYGHSGKPCLVFPSQSGRFFDFENNGMIDCIKDFINSGLVQVFCVDSIDDESWSNKSIDNRLRIENHEKYFNYICDELIPRIRQINQNPMIVTGCSMGASHALNFFLRRCDLFNSVIALSGVYSASYFFDDYMDDLVYKNSVINYIEGMNYNHDFVKQYRNKNIILCVGQGAWEDEMLIDTLKMKELFAYKDIDCWVDIWGKDCNHNWDCWRKQLPYFMSYVV